MTVTKEYFRVDQGIKFPDGTTVATATGLVGYTGSAGTNGTNGTNGATGYTGSVGAQGAQGNVGFTGSAGTNGTNGATGYTGSAGTNGTNGTNGATGYTGSQGSTGATGPTGPQGATGATGYTGSQGAQGITGATGYTGSASTISGPSGPQGPIGYTGSKGADGGQLTAGSYVVKGQLSGNQTITSGSDQVVQFVDDFDPQNWLTSNKFQPTQAGYYSLSVSINWGAAAINTQQCNIQFRKNGSTQVAIFQTSLQTASSYNVTGSEILYFNGSTDYIEVTAYTSNTTSQVINANAGTFFTAALYAYGPSGYTGSIGYTGSAGTISGTVADPVTFSSTATFSSGMAIKYPIEAIYDLGTTGGTIAPNPANGSVQKITLNSALTINAFTNPIAGQSMTLIIYGGTSYTSITSTMKFAGGIKTLTASSGCIDILSIYYDGTNYFASLAKGFA